MRSCDYAVVAHQDDHAVVEALAQSPDGRGQSPGIAGVAAKRLHRRRAAPVVALQAVDYLAKVADRTSSRARPWIDKEPMG